MFCENCGAELPETAVFCKNCGTKIEESVCVQKKDEKDIGIKLIIGIVVVAIIVLLVILLLREKRLNSDVEVKQELTKQQEVLQETQSIPEKFEISLLTKETNMYEIELGYWYEYEYDLEKRSIKIFECNSDEDKILEEERLYDDKWRVEKVSYYNCLNERYEEYFYNEESIIVMKYTDEGKLQEKTIYDELGRCIEYTKYNTDNGVMTRWEKKSKYGNWINMDFNDDGSVQSIYFCDTEYVKDGKKEFYYYEDGYRGWCYYEYNENGELIRETRYDGNNDVEHDYIYEYDRSGNLIRETQYDKNNDIENDYIYEYDENDNLIKESHNNNVKEMCEYNTRGNVTKRIFYEANGSVSEWSEWEYDEEGRIVGGIQDAEEDGKGGVSFECIYDSKGNRTQVVVKNQYGDNQVVEAEYIHITLDNEAAYNALSSFKEDYYGISNLEFDEN